MNSVPAKWAAIGLLLCLIYPAFALAAPVFPELKGPVSDYGDFLSPSAEQALIKKLQAHENATGNQVVVATLPDLQGYPIEQYGYQLAREWGIGQKDKDNGVVLIVARAERKIRIEVGYGLEGVLTDAISANIIHTVIEPAFKRGRFEQGIVAGTTAIIDALGGAYQIKKISEDRGNKRVFLIILLAMIFWPMFFMFFPAGPRGSRYGHYGDHYVGGFGRGGYGGGGFGGGGFSGGGGGFGGGGASGGW